MALTIAKLAQACGVGVETVRYYQRRGLLPEPQRSNGEIRRYGQEEVRRLRFIRTAKSAGFTLEEIRELLVLDATDDRTRAREMAHRRVQELDARIAEMGSARDALARLADACGSRASGPCPIISAFEGN